MRKSVPLFTVLLAVLVAIVWYSRPSGGLDKLEPVVAADNGDPTIPEPADLAPIEPVLQEPEDLAEARTEAVEPQPVEQESAYPRSHVFGVVTNEDGSPLAEVDVNLHTVGERWVSEELYPDEVPKFETRTNALGMFELDVPLPTSDWIGLTIRPSDFHTLTGREFGPAGGRDQEPLHEGDNDLGTFVLVNAGAFAGTVKDETGAPIAKTRVRLDGSFPGGYGVGTRGDEDGTYRVGRAPAGHYAVEALAEGFVTGKRADVEVVDGEVTFGIDFTLKRASSIAGRILDEEGNPLAKVRLWGWPKGSGQGAGTRSAADGTFTIYLPQNEPYTLEAELAGYEKFDTGRRKHFEPGTKDIEVVLRRPDLMTYIVEDSKTGAPIERFGLKIIRVRSEGGGTTSSSAHREAARIEDHAGGEVQMPGHARFDDYTIVAPGYGPQRGRVALDDGGAKRQTIRLDKGGAITGQFMMDGKPLYPATIRIEGDRVPLRPDITEGEDDIFSSNWGLDLDQFEAQVAQHRGDQDGRFRIEDLAPGTYKLNLIAQGASPHTMKGIVVERGETVDLGEIEAYLPGEIHGTIALPGGVSTSGIVIAPGSMHFNDDERAVTTDTTGTFVFKGLAQGTHYLWIQEKAGVILRGEPIVIELGRGEIRELILDLSDRVPCELEVQVRFAGQPVEGVSVGLTRKGETRDEKVGLTNASGVVVAQVSQGQDCSFRVHNSFGLVVGTSAELVTLHAGDRRRIDLDFNPGRLRVFIPVELEDESDQDSFFALVVKHAGAEAGREFVHAQPHDWKPVDGGRRLNVGWIEPGKYRLSLRVGRRDLTAEVEVVAQAEASCSLSE